MMDFDGTITEKGSAAPSKKMSKTLIETAKKVPVAFCTGRQLESFKKHGLVELIKYIPKKELNSVLKNIFLIGENGSIGYYFDTEIEDYKEFYRAKWPNKLIEKEKLMIALRKKISEFGEVINMHRVVLVIRAYHKSVLTPINLIYERSKKIYRIVQEHLQKLNKNYEKYLHIGDSGIGVILCPANGDKDTGTKKLGQFLKKTRGIKFDTKYREILVIGDSQQKGGNDYYFLNGKYGTPYTVGENYEKTKYPHAVYNEKKQRLLHEKGTISLINKYF